MKNFFKTALFIATCTSGIFQHSYANTDDLFKATQQFPKEIKPEFIDKSPIDNLYLISNARGNPAAIDASGRYLIVGKIFDMKTGEEITEQNYQKHYAINVKDLPLNQAFKEVKGNGKRVLYVFADPDCPACQGLQEMSEDLEDVTIYTFPFALTHLHPTALETAKKIWCSDAPLKAWKAYMLENEKPKNSATACTNPVDKNMQLTAKLKIAVTPTLFNARGERLVGVPEFEDLDSFIGE